MKKQIKLNSLNVTSFVTEISGGPNKDLNAIKGGMAAISHARTQCCGIDDPYSDFC